MRFRWCRLARPAHRSRLPPGAIVVLKSVRRAVVCFLLAVTPAHAATNVFGAFIVDDEFPDFIILSGRIQHNAPIDLQRALRAYPGITAMALDSGGGDVTAGLLIAQEVFDRKISTYVAPDFECLSACAYIFLAGAERQMEGQLGVHQIANSDNDPYSLQLSISDMLDTLGQFDVPPKMISEMLRTAPSSMRVYDAEDAQSMGLNRGDVSIAATDDAPPPPEPQPQAPVTEQTYALPPNSVPPPYDAPQAVPYTQTKRAPYPASIYIGASGGGPAIALYGSVYWTRDIDENGVAMIVAEASIPRVAKTIELKVTWKKNGQSSMPADIIMNARIYFTGPGWPDDIARLVGVLAKNEAMVPGTAAVGAPATVRANEFLFAFSGEDPASMDNAILLSDTFIDLAVVHESGRNAILTLQKDDAAKAMFREVMESWIE